MEEVAASEERLGVRFDAIVLPSSSGGTQAGLEVGKRLFGLDRIEVIGISPDDSAAEIVANIMKAIEPMLAILGLKGEGIAAGIKVDDGYIGEAYGIPTEASREACRLWSESEGLLLDPVYTAKASAALFARIRSGMFQPPSTSSSGTRAA